MEARASGGESAWAARGDRRGCIGASDPPRWPTRNRRRSFAPTAVVPLRRRSPPAAEFGRLVEYTASTLEFKAKKAQKGQKSQAPVCSVSTVSNYCSRAGATTREGRGPYQRMQSHDPLFVTIYTRATR